MNVTYSSDLDLSPHLETLAEYRSFIKSLVATPDYNMPESCLLLGQDSLLRTSVTDIVTVLGEVEHVVLVGIGGSSLGAEAVQAALKGGRKLYVLDSVSPHRVTEVIDTLAKVPLEQIAVCAISKSGSTTETLSNTSVLLAEYEKVAGQSLVSRTVAIGDPNNKLLITAADMGMHTLAMHAGIGGRYSVFTAVGLVPLALLGYSVDDLLHGLNSSVNEAHEQIAAEGAAHLFEQIKHGMHICNFFAFDTRLEKMGRWYRQLTAESLGKELDINGAVIRAGFMPTISTPVELHSVGQLYFSGFEGVFTDMVRSADNAIDYIVPESIEAASALHGKSLLEVHEAIFGGVVGAYKERGLPHRTTEIERGNQSAVSTFMGVRMLETMYLAQLLRVDAFDQPNVELYKDITRDILSA